VPAAHQVTLQEVPMRLLLAVVAASCLAAVPAAASGPLQFQHGGRPTAQVGAFTARATDAVAVAYNPAAVARLDGSNYQLGLDFTAPRDDYESSTGFFAQDHLITETPAFYATWHLPEDYQPFAFGIGFDTTAWYLADWIPALFPGRFLTNRQEVKLWSVHPVVAYELGERWSLGGGFRYYFGDLGYGSSAELRVLGSGGSFYDVEVSRRAESDADGFGLDVGLHYDAPAWGWGLVFDTGAEVEGNGTVKYTARDVPNDPVVQSILDARLRNGGTSQSFDLPWELRSGFWVAPYPELRVELDVVWTGWSVEEDDVVTYEPNAFGGPTREVRARDWEDTLSLRLGVEGDLADHWMASGGLAWEPTPVPSSTLEPGFARGDAIVAGLGMSYRSTRVILDLGYSFYFYDERGASGQELENPQVSGTYSGRDQVWAFSASFRR
jgi:long-chain fatty acid transport protein